MVTPVSQRRLRSMLFGRPFLLGILSGQIIATSHDRFWAPKSVAFWEGFFSYFRQVGETVFFGEVVLCVFCLLEYCGSIYDLPKKVRQIFW